MQGQWRDQDHVTLELSRNELLLLNNALNEVCHGLSISEWEFPTRLGLERSHGVALLRQISDLSDARKR